MSCCDLSLPPKSKFVHCTGCCRTFFGPSCFDHHRLGAECFDPELQGMRSVDRNHLGPVWQRYIEPRSTEPGDPVGRVQKAYAEMTDCTLSEGDAAALLRAVPTLEKWTVLDLTTALTDSTVDELADPAWWRRVMEDAPLMQAHAARNVGGRGRLPAAIVRRFNAYHLDELRPGGAMSDEALKRRLRMDQQDARRARDPLAKNLVPRQRAGTFASEHGEGSRA